MKKSILSLVTLIALITLIPQYSVPQVKPENMFYVGIGTSVSSFLGSDFGKTFAIRYSPSGYYNNDNYYNNYYNRYDDYNNNRETFFPLQVDLAVGMNVSKILSVQLESSVLWHLNGRVDRNYETGTEGDYDYIDYNDNSSLISVPIMASVKLYPFGKKRTAFYMTGGYGVQYIQEGVDRIRSYYDYTSYGNTYYSDSYEYPLAEYKGREWLHGFKVGMGVNFKIMKSISCDVELKATNFFPPYKDNTSPLSMYRSPNITNISLGTKVYLGL
jgi:hypothetical protein